MLAPMSSRPPDEWRPIDVHAHNPRGFLRTPTRRGRAGRFSRSDGVLGLDIATPGGLLRVTADADLRAARPALRRLRHIDASAGLTRPLPARRPRQAARLLATLAANGVPIVTGDVPPWLRAALHDDVVTALESATAADTALPLRREAVALRQRRTVFRRHCGLPQRPVSALVATR